MRTWAPSSMSSLGGSNSFSAILMVLCTWSTREVDPQGHQGADSWPHQVKGDDPRIVVHQNEPIWGEGD